MFKGKSVAELENVISQAKAELAIARVIEKAEAEVQARANFTGLNQGDVITVVYKGNIVEAVFEKLTDRRLIASVNGLKRTFLFHNVVWE